MPLMEILPFASSILATAVAALIARDGALAMVATAVTGGGAWFATGALF